MRYYRYGKVEAGVKYFRQLKADLVTRPFLAEIAAVSGRQNSAAVRREATPLRGVRKSCIGDRALRDVHETRWTDTSRSFRYTCNFLKAFADERGVELGRAKLALLSAGQHVNPRIDDGDYHLFRDRYHLVLKSPAGSWLKAGDEDIVMREGELWWFDNKTLHEAANPGAEDCIHLVFDALNADGKRMLDHATRVRRAREGDAASLAL